MINSKVIAECLNLAKNYDGKNYDAMKIDAKEIKSYATSDDLVKQLQCGSNHVCVR